MHLVNAHGGAVPFLVFAGFHPLVIGPCVTVQVEHNPGGLLAVLRIKSERIALEKHIAVTAFDLEFVVSAPADTRNEDFPDAHAGMLAHGVCPTIPAVPIAHNTHALGVGSPDGEQAAPDAVAFQQMRPEFLIKLPVVALCKKVQVEGSE